MVLGSWQAVSYTPSVPTGPLSPSQPLPRPPLPSFWSPHPSLLSGQRISPRPPVPDLGHCPQAQEGGHLPSGRARTERVGSRLLSSGPRCLQNSQHDPISQLAGFRGKWEQTTGNPELSRPIQDTQHNPTTLSSFVLCIGDQTLCFSGDWGRRTMQHPNPQFSYWVRWPQGRVETLARGGIPGFPSS